MELIQEADRSKWIAHSNHTIKCFTKGDIQRMTNSYRTSLGRGAFGQVYEGVLEDQSKVAVKRFISNVKENFAKEFLVHREINHKNVVRLIGYCLEENDLVLVTEYMANGNLSDFLHKDNCPIALHTRLRIAIECAEALAYMHSHMYTHVIHGDIKPGNILLGSNFHAKLSDFGISRLINMDNTVYTENVIGSIGYMDPLFSVDGRLTTKNDVYSFGVVLLELITRKKATSIVDNVNIVSAFTNALARGVRGVRDMFDAKIVSKKNLKLLEGVAKLVGKCLRMDRDERPEMVDVAESLRLLWKLLHQDQGQLRVDLLSWVIRKIIPAPPPIPNPSGLEGIETDLIPYKSKSPSIPFYPRQFSFAEIEVSTNNFDESLCIGNLLHSHGSGIFRGQIQGKKKIYGQKTNVAIKRYHPEKTKRYPWVDELDLLERERLKYEGIFMMSKHQHRHLVPLIGYCIENCERIIVYDYMARGSLRDHLYGTQNPPTWKQRTQNSPLTWKQRLEICIGAARGLRYLHKNQIIHHTISTNKILLDEEWVAKIAWPSRPSFGMAWLIRTSGYLDPEYLTTDWFTKESDGRFLIKSEESDVYSFGVVLLEALCARRAYDTLVRQASRCKEEGNLNLIIDPYLIGRVDPLSLDKFVEIAWKCVAPKCTDRPSMGDVVSNLEYALQLQDSGMASEGGSRA